MCTRRVIYRVSPKLGRGNKKLGFRKKKSLLGEYLGKLLVECCVLLLLAGLQVELISRRDSTSPINETSVKTTSPINETTVKTTSPINDTSVKTTSPGSGGWRAG